MHLVWIEERSPNNAALCCTVPHDGFIPMKNCTDQFTIVNCEIFVARVTRDFLTTKLIQDGDCACFYCSLV